jgi:signal peptidase II
MPKSSPPSFLLLITSVLVGLDQLAKFLIIHSSREYSVNRGLPFVGDNFFLSVGVYVLLFAVLLLLIFKMEMGVRRRSGIAISLVLSGAGSNLIDRLTRGGVVDFVDIKIWPVFNLADVFIVIGVAWLCFVFLYKKA